VRKPGLTLARILIADDSHASRRFAVQQALGGGHQVVEAVSGYEALDCFDPARFDVVLLDVMMPGLDGFETCRRMRARPDGTSVPIIFMTALEEQRAMDGAVAAGGDDVLVKPFRGAELNMRVRALLRTYETLRNERAATELAVRQREEVLQLTAQKDALTEFLVHDLKSPLASVAFTIHELLERVADEPYRVPLRSCLSATDTASRMVMNLLDLSVGRLDVHAVRCEVASLVDHMRDHFAVRLEVRGVSLVTRAEIESVWADRELLRRVAENLIDNALRYAPGDSEVLVSLEAHPGGALLTVTDRGPGVPLAHRERIFDRFVQLDPLASSRASRGLGLAFCRFAMDSHHGRIWVDDAPGGGARFQALFPGVGGAPC